jgi:hypothetical protein
VRGVAARRDYWATAISQQANLRNEVLTFDGDGLVCVRHGTYLE